LYYFYRFYVLQKYTERRTGSGGKEESKGRSVENLINERRKAETKGERMTYNQEY